MMITQYKLILFSATPTGIDFKVVKATFLSIGEIEAIHSIRIWCLTTEKFALSAHLAISNYVY